MAARYNSLCAGKEIMTKGKTGVIGVGNIAGALLDGVLNSSVLKAEDIVLYDIMPDKARRFVDQGCIMAGSEAELAGQCQTIVLAVKPQGFPELLEKLKDVIDESKLVISVAAGIGIDQINKGLGKTVPVVRVLPNTPMLLGCGVSAITYKSPVTEEQYRFACDLFRSCSEVYFVEESKFNEIICVHSSSPAYAFLIFESMAQSAEKQGIDKEQAMKMITETFIGAAKMVQNSELSCSELIQMVASKGGTTEASLRSFEQNGLSKVIDDAMLACTRRAEELGNKN